MAQDAASDPRIAEGMAAQRALLEDLLGDGATLIGFKAGFGSAGGLELLEITAPLIGFMTDRTSIATIAGTPTSISLEGWHRPIAEAEVAVRIGRDLPRGVSEADALAAVEAIAPAIEIADLDLDPAAEAVSAILAGDIYHRGVMLGEFRATPGGWLTPVGEADVTRVAHDGSSTTTSVSDVEAVPGTAGSVLTECARVSELLGRGLRQGDIVILGSIVPPCPVGPGERFRVDLEGFAPLTMAFDG